MAWASTSRAAAITAGCSVASATNAFSQAAFMTYTRWAGHSRGSSG